MHEEVNLGFFASPEKSLIVCNDIHETRGQGIPLLQLKSCVMHYGWRDVHFHRKERQNGTRIRETLGPSPQIGEIGPRKYLDAMALEEEVKNEAS